MTENYEPSFPYSDAKTEFEDWAEKGCRKAKELIEQLKNEK